MSICLDLIEKDIDWLSRKTKIDRIILIGFKFGQGKLTPERLETIAYAMDIEPETLSAHYWRDETRRQSLEVALREEGMIPSETSARPVMQRSEPELPLSFQEEEPHRPLSDSKFYWRKNDRAISFRGQQYLLNDKAFRKQIVKAIRRVMGKMSFETLLSQAKISRPAVWLYKVGRGNAPITRQELEAITEVCGVKVETLLADEES